MKHIFISGAISNDPEYFEHFSKAQEELIELGFKPVNPALVTKPLVDLECEFTYEQWMDIAFNLLKQCDGIYHLDHWWESKGSTREHCFAKAYQMPILYQSSFEFYRELQRDGVDVYQEALKEVDS